MGSLRASTVEPGDGLHRAEQLSRRRRYNTLNYISTVMCCAQNIDTFYVGRALGRRVGNAFSGVGGWGGVGD